MRNSIRYRLAMIFVGLAIGPLIVAGVILVWRSFAVQREQALALQRQTVESISTEVASLFRQREWELRFLEVSRFGSQSRTDQIGLLSVLLQREGVYQEVVLLDGNGQEQIRLSRVRTVPDSELGTRSGTEPFERPKSTGTTYYSPVWFSEETGEPYMTIAVPRFDLRSGELAYVLVADFRFKTVWDLIADEQAGKSGAIYVVSNIDNQVVAHQNPSIVLQGTVFDPPDDDGFHTGLEGVSAALAIDRIQLGEQELSIIAERPTSAALALAISTTVIVIAVVSASLALAGGLGFLAVRQIVRPIEALSATARSISAGDLSQRTDVTTRDEIGDLAKAFNSMTARLQETLDNLERRVAQRTEVLQAASDVSRVTRLTIDPEQLVREVVEVVRRRFDLYYVGLFLVDERERYAVLQAGTGDFGRAMLAQGYQLPVSDASMIGRSVLTNEPVVALDVGDAGVRFENPLLPDTRSELALPLRSRGRVIGAMTVQSTVAVAFDETNIDALQTMADQIAGAIDNARLLADAQAAVRDLEAAQRQYLGRAWAGYVQGRTVRGYARTQSGEMELDAQVLPEVRQAVAARRPIIGRGRSARDGQAQPGGTGTLGSASSSSALVAPIIYQDQPIGALGVRDVEGNRQWSVSDIELAQAISEQFAQAAENLRLIESTQQRESLERIIREVTADIRAAVSIEDAIRRTLLALGRTLGDPEMVVRVGTEETLLSNAPGEQDQGGNRE